MLDIKQAFNNLLKTLFEGQWYKKKRRDDEWEREGGEEYVRMRCSIWSFTAPDCLNSKASHEDGPKHGYPSLPFLAQQQGAGSGAEHLGLHAALWQEMLGCRQWLNMLCHNVDSSFQ